MDAPEMNLLSATPPGEGGEGYFTWIQTLYKCKSYEPKPAAPLNAYT